MLIRFNVDSEGFILDDISKVLINPDVWVNGVAHAGVRALKVSTLEGVQCGTNEVMIALELNDEGRYQMRVISKKRVDDVRTVTKEVPVEVEKIKEVVVEKDNTDQVQVE